MKKLAGARWLRRLVYVLIALEIVYLVAANVFLNTQLGTDLVNQRPEKMTITWDGGWSPFPGPVMIRGLVWERRSPSVDFRLEAERLSAWAHVLPLLTQRIWISRTRAKGVSMAMWSVPPGTRPPATKPNPRKKPGWRLWMRGIGISQVKGFSFDDLQVNGGQARLTGILSYQERALVGVDDLELEWLDAVLTGLEPESHEAVTVAEPLSLTFSGGIQPFDEIDVGGPAVIPYFYGELGIEGLTEQLAGLEVFFRNVEWMERVDGRGELEALVRLRDGRLLSPSRVEFVAHGLEADFLGWSAEGTGRVEAKVKGPDESSTAELRVGFDDFAIRRNPEPRPQVLGDGLEILATARDPVLPDGFRDLDVLVNVPDSRVPDFGIFAQYLPDKLGLAGLSGSARIMGHLEAWTAKEQAEGALSVIAEGVKTKFHDLNVESRVELDARISGSDLVDHRVKLEGSSLRITDGVYHDDKKTQEEGWWMTVEVPRGTARLKAPMDIEGDIELSMKDTRALVALFAETKQWAKRFEGLFTVKDIQAQGHAQLQDRSVSVSGFDLTGENLVAAADLDLAGGLASGLLYLKFHGIDVGVELEDNERAWKIVRARKWFEKARAERRAGAESKDAVDPVADEALGEQAEEKQDASAENQQSQGLSS